MDSSTQPSAHKCDKVIRTLPWDLQTLIVDRIASKDLTEEHGLAQVMQLLEEKAGI